MLLGVVALYDADAREYLMYLCAYHRRALERLSRPLLDLSPEHLNWEDEKREPDQDEAEGRKHVIGNREPDDEADRNEYLKRRKSDLRKDCGQDYLYLVRIAVDARQDLPHVHAPEELHVLLLHMLEHFLPQVGDCMRSGPA